MAMQSSVRLALEPIATVLGGIHLMQQLEFQLRGEFVELNQLLKLTGVCDSGGAGKALVAEGLVSVDGQVESRKTAKIRAGQVVTVGDVQIRVLA
jgi:ribosome-associated protein